MEQHQQHQPRLYTQSEIMKAIRPGPADSPPPNCAICLGTCTNKCFTDCCLHQFCFNCLLEWSKIKAECPLCKQPFKSIIYNIKSNLEYEEHVITNPEREVENEDILLGEYLFLPNAPRPQRHFQFRTTLTLEPGGEFAIQELLLSHPRTNSLYLPSDRYGENRLSQHALDQRRNIYRDGLWVIAQPDITGRFRECSPTFFRENPAQTHRIIPWLNRELIALLDDDLDVIRLQNRIMGMLCHYPIRSTVFRINIASYLNNRTDHFIHEFYNFVRSPYDMIGYDRHVTYAAHPGPSATFSQFVSDDDSDVRVVDSPTTNDDCIYVPPGPPEVIVIDSDSSHDSDVVIRTPPPIQPIVVDLLDSSDTDENIPANHPPQSAEQPNNEQRRDSSRSPQLPIKIRWKLNHRQSYKHKDAKKSRKTKRPILDSDSDSYDPKTDSEYSTSSHDTESSDDKYLQSLIVKKNKIKLLKRKDSKYKISKYRCSKRESKDDSRSSSRKKSKKSSMKHKKSKRREKRHKRIKTELPSTSNSEDRGTSSDSDADAEYRRRKKPTPPVVYDVKLENNSSCSEPTGLDDTTVATGNATTKQDVLDVAGPSHVPCLRSVIVKGNNMWFSRPDLNESTSTDNNSD